MWLLYCSVDREAVIISSTVKYFCVFPATRQMKIKVIAFACFVISKLTDHNLTVKKKKKKDATIGFMKVFSKLWKYSLHSNPSESALTVFYLRPILRGSHLP